MWCKSVGEESATKALSTKGSQSFFVRLCVLVSLCRECATTRCFRLASETRRTMFLRQLLLRSSSNSPLEHHQYGAFLGRQER